MIIYFSGTGNSRFAAQTVAARIGDECVNVFDCLKNSKAGSFSSEKPYVFVCPTYSWRIPRVFEAFIRKSTFEGSKKAYFIMTCGSEVGNAEKYLLRLCDDCGFEYMGALETVMPENYVAMFSVPGSDEARRMIKASLPVLYQGAACILDAKPFQHIKTGVADRLKSSVVNSLFYKFIVSAKDFCTDGRCVSCGKCEQVCPLNNIKLTDGKPEWGKNCTHCMACICSCPAQAIEYGSVSKGKPRYFNSYKPSDFE